MARWLLIIGSKANGLSGIKHSIEHTTAHDLKLPLKEEEI
jgi:hypothetical protein